MKKLLVWFICTMLAAPVAAQTITRKMDLSGFSEIEIEGVFDVTLIQSDRYSVDIAYDEPLKVKAYVEGKRLILRTVFNEKNYRNTPHCRAIVRMPKLERLSISGASSLTCEGKFAGESFGLRASGASKISGLDLEATNVELHVSGACSMGFIGKTETAQCYFSGAAKIRMKLQSDRQTFDVSGACKIEADLLCDELKAKVSGATSLKLNGKTDLLTIDNLGASKIEATGMQANRANVTAAGAASSAVRVTGTLNANLTGVCHMTYTGDPQLGTISVGELCSLKKAD